MNDKDNINITFKIASIKTLKFLIDNVEAATKTAITSFEFNLSIASFVDSSKKIIGFNVIVDVFTDKSLSVKVSELITQIVYDIVNFEQVVYHDKDKKELKIPDPFMTTLLSIALSTTRGIFAAKTEGSVLDKVYIPVLDPKLFKIQQPLVQ